MKNDPGRTWDVKIRKIDGVFYFVDGWWSDFVVDNGVRETNILLFQIVGPSAFEVSIYSEEASGLKTPSPPPPHPSSSPPPFEVSIYSEEASGLKTPSPPPHPSSSPPPTLALPVDNKRRDKRVRTWIVGPSAFEVSIYSEEASGLKTPSPLPHPSSSPPPTVSLPVDNKRSDKRVRTWRFIKKLKNNNIKSQRLNLPKKFARGTGLVAKKKVELENEEGSRWTVGITDRKIRKFCFSRGFKKFLKDNNLEEHSILVFEYMRDDDDNDVVKVAEMDGEEGEKMLGRAMVGGLLPF